MNDLPIFAMTATSIVLEAAPFLILGALIGALIEVFVSEEALLHLVPRNPAGQVAVGLFAGILLPTCECGIVPVARRLIVCCFADSIGVMCLVKVDDPQQYKAGAWVRVLSVLEEGAPPAKKPLDLDGTLTDIWGERFVLRAREVAEQPVLGLPFLFEVRVEAPFAY